MADLRPPLDFYGTVQGSWRPYLPSIKEEIASIARRIAIDENLRFGIKPADGDLINQLQTAQQNNKIVAIMRLVHDSLLEWPRLKDWITEHGQFLLWRQQLRSRLAHWQRTRDPEHLVQGVQLPEALKCRGVMGSELNRSELEFLDRSASATVPAAWRFLEQLPKLTENEKRRLWNILDQQLADEGEESPEFLAELDARIRALDEGARTYKAFLSCSHLDMPLAKILSAEINRFARDSIPRKPNFLRSSRPTDCRFGPLADCSMDAE
jgi:hypothetical protein